MANRNRGADVILLMQTSQPYILKQGEGDEGGDLDIKSKVTIRGVSAPLDATSRTTISANGVDRVFHVADGGELTLENVNVVDGLVTAPDSRGGGILIEAESRGHLVSCSVTNNQALGSDGGGGGIYAMGRLQLEDCWVNENKTNGIGGGIYLDSARGEFLQGRVFLNRSDNSTARGGGIYAKFSELKLRGVWILGNTATGNTVLGGGVLVKGMQWLTVDQCTFTRNVAQGKTIASGGGLSVTGFTATDSRMTVKKTRFDSNEATSGFTADGGGIFANNGDLLEIKNCTIVFNRVVVEAGSGGGGGLSLYNIRSRTVKDCAIQENSVVVHSGNAHGGGLKLVGASSPENHHRLLRNNIAKNTVDGSDMSLGGGAYLLDYGYASNWGRILSNLAWENAALNGTKRVGGFYFSSVLATFRDNEIKNSDGIGLYIEPVSSKLSPSPLEESNKIYGNSGGDVVDGN